MTRKKQKVTAPAPEPEKSDAELKRIATIVAAIFLAAALVAIIGLAAVAALVWMGVL
jgi:hypothetical protein